MKPGILAVGFLFPLFLMAQEPADTSRFGYITVRSQPSGARVFLDSVYAGQTPLSRYKLPAGEHEMSVYYPSPLDWNAFVQQKSFSLEGGSEIESSFEFGMQLAFHSVPSGAIVTFQGSELGRTPFFYRGSAAMRGNVTIGKDDYQSVTFAIQDMPPIVRLVPIGNVSTEITVEYPSAALPRKWMTIGSAAGMVVSGVAAAYFKDRANGQFDQYSTTNNPSFLSSTHRYDRLSLISLVITQATFALLIYSLLSNN